MSKKKTSNSFTLPSLHEEVQTYFEYLKRLNPATFQHVTPEFITESLQNFEADQAKHIADVAATEKIRRDALAENQASVDDAKNQIRLHAQKRIDEARAKVKAEDDKVQADAAERKRQSESTTDTEVVDDSILDNLTK